MKVLNLKTQVPAISVTLGLAASYLVAYRYMTEQVTDTPLRIVWFSFLTYASGAALSLAKKKSTLLSDILYSFSVYNLVTLLYLLYPSTTVVNSEGILATFFKTVVLFGLGYPIAFATMLPAIILSVILMRVSRMTALGASV